MMDVGQTLNVTRKFFVFEAMAFLKAYASLGPWLIGNAQLAPSHPGNWSSEFMADQQHAKNSALLDSWNFILFLTFSHSRSARKVREEAAPAVERHDLDEYSIKWFDEGSNCSLKVPEASSRCTFSVIRFLSLFVLCWHRGMWSWDSLIIPCPFLFVR